MKDNIEQIINGKKYIAERVVVGKTKLRQTIIFMGYKEEDSKTYTKNQTDEMKETAKLILWQLVINGRIGQSPMERI